MLDYDRSVGRSITGGYVFRGSGIAELSGKYVFGDFAAGKLFTMALDGSGFTDISGVTGSFGGITPSSFGLDANRNLYVVDYGGRVFRFQTVAGTTLRAAALAAVPEPATWALLLAGFGMVGVAARRQGRRISLPKLPPE